MENNTHFTETFFEWASSRGLGSKEIAKELGKKQILVSNWRSRGVPKNHQYACNAMMVKFKAIDLLSGSRAPFHISLLSLLQGE